LDVQKMLVNLY